MAQNSNENISEQLQMMQQLNATVQKLSDAMEQLTGIFSEQSEILETMLEHVEEIFDLNPLDKMIDDADEAAEALEGVNTPLDKILKQLDGMSSKNKVIDDLKKRSQQLAKQQDTLAKRTKKWFEEYQKVSLAVVAFEGLKKGISNVMASFKSLWSIASGLAESIFNIGVAIASIPFRLISNLIGIAAKSAGSTELATAREKVRENFGDLEKATSKSILSVARNMRGFSATGLSAYSVVGNLAESIEKFNELAMGMGESFNHLMKDFKGVEGRVIAYQKGLGLSAEDMRNVQVISKSMGVSSQKVFADMAKQTIALGNAFGMSAKVLSKDVAAAMKDVTHFATATVKEMTKAAVYARGLGVELDKIAGVMDAFDTFEDASENVSKLSQSLGVQVDTFELMKAKTPDEKIDMLRKAMKSAGQSAENLDRHQLKLLASATNLDERTAQAVFSMKNQGLSMDQIKKKGDAAEKSHKSQEEIMQDLAASIERIVRAGQELKDFFGQFVDGINIALNMSKEFRQMIMNIRASLIATKFAGIDFFKKLMAEFPEIGNFFGKIAEIFSPNRFKELLNNVTRVFLGFFNDMRSGKASIPNLLKELGEAFLKWFDPTGPTGTGLIETIKNLFLMVVDLVAKGTLWVAQKLTEGVKKLVEILKNYNEGGSPMSFGDSFLGKIFSQFKPVFDEVWVNLKPELIKLGGQIFDTLWNWFFSPEAEKLRNYVLLYFGLTLFGPSLANVAGTALMKAFGSALFGSSAQKAGEIASKKVLESLAKGLAEKGETTLAQSLAEGASTKGGGLMSKILPLLTNPYTLAVAAAVVIIGGIFYAGSTRIKSEAEKFQEATDFSKVSKTITDNTKDLTDRLAAADDELNKQKGIKTEAASGFWNATAGLLGFGKSEAELDAQARVEYLEKQRGDLLALKEKKDRSFIAGTQEYNQRLAEEAKQAQKEREKNILSSMGLGEGQVIDFSKITEKFQEIDKLSKQVMSKDFDLEKIIGNIRKKLDSVKDWSIMSDENSAKLVKAIAQIMDIKTLLGSIVEASVIASRAGEELKKIANPLDNLTAFITSFRASQIKVIDIASHLAASGADFTTAILNIIATLENPALTYLTQQIPAHNTDSLVQMNLFFNEVTKIGDNLMKIALQTVSSLTAAEANIAVIPSQLAKISNHARLISSDAVSGAIDTVNQVVETVNKLDKTLAAGTKVDIPAQLQMMANGLGLNKRLAATVKNGDIVIQVNLNVQMEASQIESAILRRDGSEIRMRLNRALSEDFNSPYTPMTDTATSLSEKSAIQNNRYLSDEQLLPGTPKYRGPSAYDWGQ